MLVTNLGFPRIGPNRELKRALEQHWAGKLDEAGLLSEAATLRENAWKRQVASGVAQPPSNDFSLYDHVLDTALMVGAVPERYRQGLPDASLLKTYFAMARGTHSLKPLELTKWFDTNYHYLVPEFEPDMTFSLSSGKALSEYAQAKALGIETRPVLLGPVTFALLGKLAPGTSHEGVLQGVLPVYLELLEKLHALGAGWVQLDEPMLVTALDAGVQDLYRSAYAQLAQAGPKVLLATYFGHLRGNLELATKLPVAGLHVDLLRAPEQLARLLEHIPDTLTLSLGVVDGRNIWKADLKAALALVKRCVEVRGSSETLQLAPSCSLLHSPIDVDRETEIEPEIRCWLAFAVQKLEELATLAALAGAPQDVLRHTLAENRQMLAARRSSPLVVDDEVRRRAEAVTTKELKRPQAVEARRDLQAARLNLPLLPTTTIGSFPQTAEIRRARADYRAGRLDAAAYEGFLEAQTRDLIRWQEAVGLDVLVHGEFERNDMVEYFGERLNGFAFTRHGWVQSYGSRCVKPPIIYGDVSRTQPMTVKWATFAQSLTPKPVKGMLTGPVTILKWSFVRDDQPPAETCKQIALAIRDEVLELEAAGLKIVQIDEAALREGLPIHPNDWDDYLKWAVDAFLLTASGVRSETQIHTHMCYSDFGAILGAVARMDADVVTLEASRSGLEELEAFKQLATRSALGPGVYDIHSPRIPGQGELGVLLRRVVEALGAEHVWVNPDCGLKTRRWSEVESALHEMVRATRQVRAGLQATDPS
jgi:5-methyltetrahydropteroyltriglutamate--homocysteine methyltransferase